MIRRTAKKTLLLGIVLGAIFALRPESADAEWTTTEATCLDRATEWMVAHDEAAKGWFLSNFSSVRQDLMEAMRAATDGALYDIVLSPFDSSYEGSAKGRAWRGNTFATTAMNNANDGDVEDAAQLSAAQFAGAHGSLEFQLNDPAYCGYHGIQQIDQHCRIALVGDETSPGEYLDGLFRAHMLVRHIVQRRARQEGETAVEIEAGKAAGDLTVAYKRLVEMIEEMGSHGEEIGPYDILPPVAVARRGEVLDRLSQAYEHLTSDTLQNAQIPKWNGLDYDSALSQAISTVYALRGSSSSSLFALKGKVRNCFDCQSGACYEAKCEFNDLDDCTIPFLAPQVLF